MGEAGAGVIRLRDRAAVTLLWEDSWTAPLSSERDVHVTTAFEIIRNTNALNAAGRVRMEPLLGVNVVTLYRD